LKTARDVPSVRKTVPNKKIDFLLACFVGYPSAIFFFAAVGNSADKIRNAEE
jgi:hypothetical protein